MRATHVRPYEVVGVEVDAGLDLVDLWTRERVHVCEQLGTREIVHDAIGVPGDDAIVAEDQLSVTLRRILRYHATRFREGLEERDSLIQTETECPSVRWRISANVGNDPLEVVAGDPRPDYSSHSANSRMTSSWGMTVPAPADSSPARIFWSTYR